MTEDRKPNLPASLAKINEALTTGSPSMTAKQGIVESQDFCLVDFQNAIEPTQSPLLKMGNMLEKLVGKTVVRVEWVNIPHRNRNPDGTIGRYLIHVI